METSGNMKSVAEIAGIIDAKYTYIPLLQRNYKWTMECASELAEDLWDAYVSDKETYQLNMITIHRNDEDNSLQILDGQQRLITLELFLTFLEKDSVNLNFAFERDLKIDKRHGRRYFIDHYLREYETFQNTMEMSVDIKRLYENFISMIIPVSFRSIYMFYRELLDKAISESKTVEEFFCEQLMKEFIEPWLNEIMGSDTFNKIKEDIELNDKEIKSIYKWCEKFNGLFPSKDDDMSDDKIEDDDMSDDEIRVSEFSNQYQEIWNKKTHEVIRKLGIDNVIPADKKKGLANYIKRNVEMLYHETSSEPIDEFLNINEHKTRFVISDYIRAHMISDNPVDGDIDEETREIHQKNRKEILRLFTELANYLYNAKHLDMWNLIKQRYDDFESYPDINRLKVLFCDKYTGTSTKGYSFETELKRLQYFEMVLRSLWREIELEDERSDKQQVWNTYNAVYMLLECKKKYKKKYRFFNLFTEENIKNSTTMRDVIAREKFRFFELAYELSESSEDPWDISYFLESQLYVEKCDIKKSEHLPKNLDDEWCCMNRGKDGDELHTCIQELIDNIQGEKLQ